MVDEILNKIGVDKVLHFAFSGWLTMIAFLIFENVLMSVLAVMVVGIIKEYLDESTSGFGLGDIVADMTGIATSAIILMLKI